MNKDIAQVLRSVGVQCGHTTETLPNLHAIYRIYATRFSPSEAGQADNRGDAQGEEAIESS